MSEVVQAGQETVGAYWRRAEREARRAFRVRRSLAWRRERRAERAEVRELIALLQGGAQ